MSGAAPSGPGAAASPVADRETVLEVSGLFAGYDSVPVVRGRDGQWRGIEAVIDKDFAASLLAAELSADVFMILTNVAQVSIDFNKPAQRQVERMTIAEAQKHLADGQFPSGSMGPKIEAAIQFVRSSGKTVVISDVDHIREAITGSGGTSITP
ncbi:MAG: hypothetical protein NVSMB68_16710 [Thermoanaerobaculia bacterium]